MAILVTLKHGLKQGDDTLVEATLRELSAGDIIDAREASEKLVMTPDGPGLVVSPTLLGAELLRRQIARIGNLQGPIDLVQLKRLHPEDLNRLQDKADELDEAVFAAAAMEGLSTRGRDDAAGADSGAAPAGNGQGNGTAAE
ncbi:phage tail assembly protein [Candidatus Vondammii sp. HM_W22]|uniref:phage tail assembly protein n=1 Tax=Candidatus Vondammii sp. HM_W22 TaxID=2687299 RepID=UPI001F1394F4|nr:phage tail assembly protein [Candidatus Vondammii sp. HM_W22]